MLALVSAFALGALTACAGDDGGGSGDASAAVTTSPSKAASTAGATDAVGTWGKSSTTGEAYLILGKDGTASGSDGCNQLSGSWKSGSDGISFSPWAATQMFCADVDPWLGLSTSAQVQGDELILFDENDTQIGTLQRTA